jgi:hypothetical protein
VLVGEDDDVVVENNEEVGELFAFAGLRASLVPIDARIAPERKESLVAESLQVLL